MIRPLPRPMRAMKERVATLVEILEIYQIQTHFRFIPTEREVTELGRGHEQDSEPNDSDALGSSNEGGKLPYQQ